MIVIAIANRKGGCGKSTTAAALSAGISARGLRCLAVDLDGQSGNLTRILGADRDGLTSYDVLMGKSPLRDVIQHTNNGSIIAGGPALNGIDVIISGDNRESRLKDALKTVKEDFDYVVIDTPVGFGVPVINALTAASYLIIPVQPDVLCLSGLDEMGDLADSIRGSTNPDLNICGVLLTRFNSHLSLSQLLVPEFQNVAKILGTKLFKTMIREGVAVKESQAQQISLFSYAPRSNPARDYKKFVEELLDDLGGVGQWL